MAIRSCTTRLLTIPVSLALLSGTAPQVSMTFQAFVDEESPLLGYCATNGVKLEIM